MLDGVNDIYDRLVRIKINPCGNSIADAQATVKRRTCFEIKNFLINLKNPVIQKVT